MYLQLSEVCEGLEGGAVDAGHVVVGQLQHLEILQAHERLLRDRLDRVVRHTQPLQRVQTPEHLLHVLDGRGDVVVVQVAGKKQRE